MLYGPRERDLGLSGVMRLRDSCQYGMGEQR
jgi:hypothetical protein